MAKRKEHEYKVNVTYTEGCEQRLVDALMDILYSDPDVVIRLMKKKEEEEAKAASGG
jgi:hypothetical protein